MFPHQGGWGQLCKEDIYDFFPRQTLTRSTAYFPPIHWEKILLLVQESAPRKKEKNQFIQNIFMTMFWNFPVLSPQEFPFKELADCDFVF